MLIYAGIDEAGYGPMFGPLTIGCTVFEFDNHDPADGPPDLWARLRQAVCRSKSDRKHRIAIDDSKKIKNANDGPTHPLKHLERGVLAFWQCAGGELPGDDARWLTDLGACVAASCWYDSTTHMPVAHQGDELRVAAGMLSNHLNRAGMRCAMMRVQAIDAGEFNRQYELMSSKAAVNFCAIMRLVDQVWRRWPQAHPRIVVDRQSGRMLYRRHLQICYPDATIHILNEDDRLSRYELDDGGRRMTISFVTESERRHFPVALASMTAKYVRELLMLRLNRFFTGHMPELKPTAGYVQDGRRYLKEIGPLIDRLGLSRSDLVRVV